jgi:hypothetical protein
MISPVSHPSSAPQTESAASKPPKPEASSAPNKTPPPQDKVTISQENGEASHGGDTK